MTSTVAVDIAGAQVGGAARFAAELHRYLARARREDVTVIGVGQRIEPLWLMRREIVVPRKARRIALNNVSFVCPGGERWVLLRNALHFLTEEEISRQDRSLRPATVRDAAVVRIAARRAHVLVVPSTAMANRVVAIMPSVRHRIVVRPHPVSVDTMPRVPRDMAILCPVLFAPYKEMPRQLSELLIAIESLGDPSIRVHVTADKSDVNPSLACNPRIELVGKLDQRGLAQLWARSRAIYFPTGLESFGYPLAEARVNGLPVIARDSMQNREIAGSALRGFTIGDRDSLRNAVELALTTSAKPDPVTFNPDAYFNWMLGPPQ
jgi:glycosyltransferase involved in cell wall biosynthesis